jgi:hypothetical protein
LKKVSVQGGVPNPICDIITFRAFRGADWGEDGNIIYSSGVGPLKIVPSTGGTPRDLNKLQNGDFFEYWPQRLPGGQQILFTGFVKGKDFDDANIEVLSLKTGVARIVVRGGYFGRYLPTGHLVYVHQSTLFAVPFDLAGIEATGKSASTVAGMDA